MSEKYNDKDKNATAKINLAVRIAAPSTSLWGRAWQTLGIRMGLLQIHDPHCSLFSLLQQVHERTFHFVNKPCIDSICRGQGIGIIAQHRFLSENEEIMEYEVYPEKQSGYQVKWHLTLSGAALRIHVDAPPAYVYLLAEATGLPWALLI